MSKSMRRITYFENILEFKENTKEQLNLSELNQWELCRTCLNETNDNDVNLEMSVLDVMQESFLNIQQMLVEMTNIHIVSSENLPIKVCNECFHKITALYYFAIQVRKADKILKRLANKLKYNDIESDAACETEIHFTKTVISEDSIIEFEELFDCTEDEKCNVNTKTNKDEPEKTADGNDTLDIEETSEINRTLKIGEALDTKSISEINDNFECFEEISEIEALFIADEQNHVKSKNKDSDEESQFEDDVFNEEPVSDNEETFETVIFNEQVEDKKENPIRSSRHTISPGYTHKQPRVTSPLLNDFTCAICQITYERQHDLVNHVRSSHPNSKAFKCRVCFNLFSHIQSLSRHMNSHKEAVVLHSCEVCSKSFIRVDDLKRHIRVHTGERPYACTTCDKTYQQLSDLKYHLTKCVENIQPKTFECNKCGLTYITRDGLYKHNKKYHKEENGNRERFHVCKLCEESFQYKIDLTRHSAKHFVPITIKCTQCDKNFLSRYELHLHKKKQHDHKKVIRKRNIKRNCNNKD